MGDAKREYKTLGVFFFDDIRLGVQVWENPWGSSLYRIAQLSPDLTTVIFHGEDAVYEHPAIFDCQGRTFIAMTQYLEDDSSMKPEVIYELVAPPDSNMAQQSVETRALAIMKNNSKSDLAKVLGMNQDEASGLLKERLAERVIRLKDRLGRMCRC